MDAAMDKERQVMEETHTERETRSAADFTKMEELLPTHIGSRWNISFLDNMGSFLSTLNPMAKAVNPEKEEVWLLDNTAYRPVHIYPHQPQPFQARFKAAYFKRYTGKDWSKAVASIADTLGLADGEGRAQAEKTIAHRLKPFVETIAPARYVNIKLPDGTVEKLGPGGRSAVSQQTIISIQDLEDGESAEIPATNLEVTPHGPMLTHFAEPEGWLMVSDIDDSIKITMTPSPIGILRSTFVSNPTPIAGMPELYAQIATSLNPTWFYLSASPYNLYPFLRPFLHQYYPKGTTILRDASWMDLGGFLASLTQGTETYKRTRIEEIHTWLPKRKVLCVGDSTQTDPEAYGDICRKYKGWVKAVFIRKVTDVAEMKDTDKNSEKRFEKAFREVPRKIWRTFEDPQELYEAVEQLKGM
ncbi:MAG: hypothetical protein ALECFALPRED_004248 [Alectoria fallacina]|uniref:Phosphatidate phosphatase APP1 catalytic domain-containing protein n=1 Tax=Alectoria fallacina TaxID=1903189 RepID=A0A8H3FTM3_9LECA|nr:MAG: hypothetical protein ALECFALPRED_004248 [Alectoria fallacina]